MPGPQAAPPDAPAPSHLADGSRPRLASNAAWRLGAVLVRTAVGLAAVPALTHALGMAQWGLLALFQAAVSPLALLDLGLGSATVKHVAERVGRGDRPGAVAAVHTTLVLNLAVGAAGVAALLLAAPALAGAVFAIPGPDVARATTGFRLVAATWILGVLSATYTAVLAGHQRYDVASRIASVGVVLSAGAGVAAALATRDVVWVLVAQIAATAVTAVLAFLAAAALLPGLVARPRFSGPLSGRLLGFGLWQTAALGGGLLLSWGDRWVLGAYQLPAVVGLYAIAHLLHAQLHGAFVEMGDVLYPAVADREARGDLPGARRLSLLVGWTQSSAYGVAAVALAVLGGDFVALWISPEAAAGATFTLRLLCLGGIAGMAANAPLYYLLGTGRPRWDAAHSLLVGATAVAVALWLVPRIGLAGAGWGLVAGSLAGWLPLALAWRRHFAPGATLGAFASQVWAPPVASAALLLGLAALHDAVPHAPGWPGLLLEGALLLPAALLLQVAAGEILPGGPGRRRDVVASFVPLLPFRRARGAS